MMAYLLVMLRMKICNAGFYPLLHGNSIHFKIIFHFLKPAFSLKLSAYLIARDFARGRGIHMKAKASVIPIISLIPTAL